MGTPISSARARGGRCALLAITYVLQVISVAAQFNCVGGSVYVVAHPDDDLLFISPTLLSEIHANTCITTVFLTSGDAGDGLSYAESREDGNTAAYAQMAGIANSYTDSQATFGGHHVTVRTMSGAPQIQKVFFRLPDGNTDGNGFAATGFQSLQKLYFGQIRSMKSIDGSGTFTLTNLKTAVSQILAARAPNNVRTQDYLRAYDGSDHPDHLTTARITAPLAGTANLVGYMGYPIQNLPPTMSTTSVEYQQKSAAFFTYTPYDFNACQSLSACAGGNGAYYSWLQREYDVNGNPIPSSTTTATSTAPTTSATGSVGPDLALSGTATASSANSATFQTPNKAIDGVVGGYPGDYTVEWASNGQGAGAWWKLTWASSVTINRVVLYDRPNLDDWITAGTIAFSDGSTLAITSLDNAGGATTFDFQAKTINSLMFTITAVGSNTVNIGLSEFQAYFISSTGSSSTSVGPTTTTTSTPTTTSTSSAPSSTSTSVDLALNGTASASSSSAATSQTPDKAIDGVIGGYPGDYTVEWASNGQGAGAWWKLTWASSVTINRVVLYDRPNLDDWITAGTLTFSDGSTVAVPTLDNAGGATTINFAAKTISSVQLSITGVGANTVNIGLSEFQAYLVS